MVSIKMDALVSSWVVRQACVVLNNPCFLSVPGCSGKTRRQFQVGICPLSLAFQEREITLQRKYTTTALLDTAVFQHQLCTTF